LITLAKRTVWLALVCVLLLSATAGNLITPVSAETAVGVTDDLELRMAIDNTTIIIGEWVNITLTLRNLGSSNITIWFPSSQTFDIYLYDEEDHLVCRWSDGKAFLTVVWELTLEPGEIHNATYRWNFYKYADSGYAPPKPGNYSLVGLCVGWYGTRWPAARTSKLPISLIEGDVVVRVPGDANGDGHVTGTDLAILGRTWYRRSEETGFDPRADFNLDGVVTGSDLAILGRNWYKY